MQLDHHNFPCQLHKWQISYGDIESQLLNYDLNFPTLRLKQVEFGYKFPSFIKAFYQYVNIKQRVPNQKEFWEYYMAPLISNSDILKDDQTRLGLKARVYRTYPSLVRDLHFAKFLKAVIKPNATIQYNLALDQNHGIDVLLLWQKSYFAINLYVHTARAFEAREHKEYRHKRFDNVEYIELPVQFDHAKVVGDFFLYGPNQIDDLRSILTKYL